MNIINIIKTHYKKIFDGEITKVVQYDIENVTQTVVYNFFNIIDFFISDLEHILNENNIYEITVGLDKHCLTIGNKFDIANISEPSTEVIYATLESSDIDVSAFINTYYNDISQFTIIELLCIMYIKNLIDIKPLETLERNGEIKVNIISIYGEFEKTYKALDKCYIQ